MQLFSHGEIQLFFWNEIKCPRDLKEPSILSPSLNLTLHILCHLSSQHLLNSLFQSYIYIYFYNYFLVVSSFGPSVPWGTIPGFFGFFFHHWFLSTSTYIVCKYLLIKINKWEWLGSKGKMGKQTTTQVTIDLHCFPVNFSLGIYASDVVSSHSSAYLKEKGEEEKQNNLMVDS